MLKVNDIQVSYDEVPALHGVSFSVDQGKIVSIVGANGAGKSTILKAISGLIHPVSGTIQFENQSIDHIPDAQSLKETYTYNYVNQHRG